MVDVGGGKDDGRGRWVGLKGHTAYDGFAGTSMNRDKDDIILQCLMCIVTILAAKEAFRLFEHAIFLGSSDLSCVIKTIVMKIVRII